MNEVARQRKSLGRGLSALLSDDDAPTEPAAPRGGIETVAISKLEANPDQPRKSFDETELEALAASIAEKGLLQPILVRSNPRQAGNYEIVAGERRWRAAQRAKLHEVPIVIRELSDAESLEVAIIENVQRVDLNPMEEAEGYERLIERFGYTQEQLAQTVSKSRSHVANMIRLTRLPRSVRAYLRSGALSAGHARPLIGHDDAEVLAERIVSKGLSVREAEKLAKGDAAKAAASNGSAAQGQGAAMPDANTVALQSDLGAALGTKVRIDHQGEGGRVIIDYKSLDHLDELCEKFGL